MQIVSAIKNTIEEKPLPETELIICLWQGLMSAVDWNARADQIEGLALREVTVRPPFSLEHLHGHSSVSSYIGRDIDALPRTEFHPDPRAVLQWPQDRGGVDQQRASVLL